MSEITYPNVKNVAVDTSHSIVQSVHFLFFHVDCNAVEWRHLILAYIMSPRFI